MAETERYLEGKHAIVTGANQGIGAAIATELAARGAVLTILARSLESLERHAEFIRNKHNARVTA